MQKHTDNIIPFPTKLARTPRTTSDAVFDSAPDSADESNAVRSAALAAAAAAAAIADILAECGDPDTSPDALDASKATNLGVLWGAVLGVARTHGQIPALAALEQVLARVREDPHRMVTEPQHRAAADGTVRAVRTLLSSRL